MLAHALLVMEHNRGMLSSGVLTLFWFLTILVDGVRLRTIMLQANVRLAHSSISLSLYALLLVVVEVEVVVVVVVVVCVCVCVLSILRASSIAFLPPYITAWPYQLA